MVVTPPCAACGTPSARIELVAPGQLPAEWEQWPGTVQASIVRQRQPGQWYLLFKGVAAYNGYGDPIDASRAGRIAQAFRPPLCFAQVHTAGFYDDAGFCQDCDAPYCYQPLARVRERLRLLPPRPRQEPGPALVGPRSSSDHLGVNEWHAGLCRSLVQLTGLLRSYEVGAGRIGCCTYLLYCPSALLNFGIKAA